MECAEVKDKVTYVTTTRNRLIPLYGFHRWVYSDGYNLPRIQALAIAARWRGDGKEVRANCQIKGT